MWSTNGKIYGVLLVGSTGQRCVEKTTRLDSWDGIAGEFFCFFFVFFCLSYFPSPSNRICSAPLFPDPSLLISDFSVADIGQRLWEMQLGNGKDPPGGLQVWYQLFRMYVEVYVTEARLRIRNLGVFVCCHSMFRI